MLWTSDTAAVMPRSSGVKKVVVPEAEVFCFDSLPPSLLTPPPMKAGTEYVKRLFDRVRLPHSTTYFCIGRSTSCVDLRL